MLLSVLRCYHSVAMYATLLHILCYYADLYATLLQLSLNNNMVKPKIFIDGGQHAREWISPAVILHVTHQVIGPLLFLHFHPYSDISAYRLFLAFLYVSFEVPGCTDNKLYMLIC